MTAEIFKLTSEWKSEVNPYTPSRRSPPAYDPPALVWWLLPFALFALVVLMEKI